MKKIILNRCAGTQTEIVMLILPSIAFNLNNSGRKILFKFSSFILLGHSHVRVFMVVFFSLPLMLLTTTAKIKRQYLRVLSFIRFYSCGIVGFTEQRTTFTRAQSRSWIFPILKLQFFFNLSKICSTEIFLIFPVSQFFVCIAKIF